MSLDFSIDDERMVAPLPNLLEFGGVELDRPVIILVVKQRSHGTDRAEQPIEEKGFVARVEDRVTAV